MKKSGLIALLVLIWQTAITAAPKKTVLIVPDCITTGINLSTAQACSSFVRTIMLKDGRFSVVERKYMLSILQEHQLQMTGLTDASNRKMLGKILAADKFSSHSSTVSVAYRWSKRRSHFWSNWKFIDLETGEIEIGEAETVAGVANILPTVEKLAKKFS
ncbi:MAG: CsgG/HfaB family protein [Turneriella sp.]